MNSRKLQPRIGIDLGGTKIEIVVLKNDGSILARQRANTPKDNYDGILRTISDLLEKVSTELSLPIDLPIGICTPGSVSQVSGMIMNSNSTCLNGRALPNDLEALTMRPVKIANDADCFTLSEAYDGAAKESKSVFGLILGTGVGGGIVINQQLVQGANSIAGEWGHIPLCLSAFQGNKTSFTNDRKCFCGRKNCIETWLSGPALTQTYHNTFKTPGQSQADSNTKLIAELALAGQQAALDCIDEYCHLLALALSNIINVLDPDTLVFGGGISNIDMLYERLPHYLPRYIFSDQLETKFVKAKYGDSSGVRGAAWLWSGHF